MNEEKNKTPEPTPEQLLKMLDAQMAASRQRRQVGSGSRGTGKIIALCAIIFGAAISLWVLMYLLEEMRPVPHEGDALPAYEDKFVPAPPDNFGPSGQVLPPAPGARPGAVNPAPPSGAAPVVDPALPVAPPAGGVTPPVEPPRVEKAPGTAGEKPAAGSR